MFWFTSRDGTRFLVQDPGECAQSLARAFADPGRPVTAEAFMQQVMRECPPAVRRPGPPPLRATKR